MLRQSGSLSAHIDAIDHVDLIHFCIAPLTAAVPRADTNRQYSGVPFAGEGNNCDIVARRRGNPTNSERRPVLADARILLVGNP